MADPLYELLAPYFDAQDAAPRPIPSPHDPITTSYLGHLTSLPLSAITTSEPQALAQNSQSILRSLQALSKRSHKSIIASSEHLASLRQTIPDLEKEVGDLQSVLPALENEALCFSQKYSKSVDNPILDRRRKAMLLSRNVDRVSDVLDLPTLLSTTISSSTSSAQSSGAISASTNANYASALDLHTHIKRLHTLYPKLGLIESISRQAEEEMKGMTTNLISTLQSQGIKLAGAMRTIGWLRRIAPELDESWNPQKGAEIASSEGALGALFLVCRLTNLIAMLEALEPLRDLADHEASIRLKSLKTTRNGHTDGDKWAGGQQTERYLKRYIEIFREQSFAIISMYKSIFPAALPLPGSSAEYMEGPKASSPLYSTQTKGVPDEPNLDDILQPLPSPLATFPQHLVELLFHTLRRYLPNVQDRTSRDSLLTQVLYCAGSLGRLGGDFSMMLAMLGEDSEASDEGSEDEEEEEEEEEWVEVMRKHRVQASRLELLASGVGTGRVGLAARSPSPAG